MKHATIFLLFGILCLSSQAQWVKPPEFEWARTFGGFGIGWGDNVHLRGMEIDKKENVYVCGFFENFMCFGEDTCVYSATADSSDIFLVKYDSLGNLLWLRTFGEGGIDEAVGLVLDNSGNPIVGLNFTYKIELDGIVILAADPSGYPYGSADGAILFFDTSGIARSFFKPDLSLSWNGYFNFDLSNISISPRDELFITGITGSSSFSIGAQSYPLTPGHKVEFFIIGINLEDQSLIFADRLGSTGIIENLEANHHGEVFMEGYFLDSMKIGGIVLGEKLGNQRFLLKLSADGKLVWSRVFTTTGTDIQYVKTDENDNVYLSGGVSETVRFDSVTFVGGYFLIKLDSDMKAIWGYSFGQDRFAANNITIHDQAIYTVGRFSFEQVIEDTTIFSSGLFPSALSSDILLLRHDPETGELVWFKQIGWTGDEGGGFLRGAEDGNLFLTGGFSDRYSYLDSIEMVNPYPGFGRFFISRLQADSLPPPLSIPEDGWLLYPNPIQNQFTIAGEWQDGTATMEWFAPDGRLVHSSEFPTDANFTNVTLSLPPGMTGGLYLLRIFQREKVMVRKMLVQ